MSLVAVLLATLAFGQDAVPAHSLEAEALYQQGLELFVAEWFEEACAVFLRIGDEYADTRFADAATEQARLIGMSHPETPCAQTRSPQSADGGRVELIVSQSLVGPALMGLFIPMSFEGDEVVVPVTGAFVGLGLGLGGTYWVTRRHPVTEGQAMAIYSGEVLGGWNGAWIAATITRDDGLTTVCGGLSIGTVVGGAAGLAVAVLWSPDPGSMALMRSGATWGTYASAATFLIEPIKDDHHVFSRLGVATDVGVLAGWAISRALAGSGGITRLRVNLINLGGYAGALVGGGIGLLAYEYWSADDPVMGGLLLGGATLGIGLSVVLTRNMRSSTLAASDGVLLGHDADGWRFGVPVPVVVPGREGGIDVSVPLAQGTF